MDTKVLLVDDDLPTMHVLAEALESHLTVFAASGKAALHQIGAEHPDLVLLDLTLPDIDGLLLVSMIRKISKVPIIVLSARQASSDCALSLKLGADDFIAKPFDLDDLDARIESVLRRSKKVPIADSDIAQFGSLTMSIGGGVWSDGLRVSVTPMQYPLLHYLVAHAPDKVTRKELAEYAWGTSYATDRLLYCHIRRLRKRLRDAHAPEIETVHGGGYRIGLPVQ